MVFDGARAFEGGHPTSNCIEPASTDRRRFYRGRRSVSVDNWTGCRGRIETFCQEFRTYIRPMYWAETALSAVCATTPRRSAGASRYERRCGRPTDSRSRYRRPASTNECAPVEPSGCLYPQQARSSAKRKARGSTCLVRECSATSLSWDRETCSWRRRRRVYTPEPNGTFPQRSTRPTRLSRCWRAEGAASSSRRDLRDLRTPSESFSP